MLPDADQLPRDALGREDEIDAALGRRGARHAVVLRGLLVLRKRDAAFALDHLQPECAVGGRSGQNDADRLRSGIRSQRPEEVVDGHMLPPHGRPGEQLEGIVGDHHVGVGRDHVNMVGLHLHAVADLQDWHRAAFRKQFRQQAFVLRIQVLHEHEGHPGVPAEVPQESGKRFQAAGGCTDANHRALFFRLLGGLRILRALFFWRFARPVLCFARFLGHGGQLPLTALCRSGQATGCLSL